jgi:hypothetical protein
MNKTLLAALNDAERQLVAEAERPALDRLDEDETLALHADPVGAEQVRRPVPPRGERPRARRWRTRRSRAQEPSRGSESGGIRGGAGPGEPTASGVG